MKAIDVSPLDAGLLDAVVRLVRLLDAPAEASFLAPMVRREIVYRLLMGEQGGRLRHTALPGGNSHLIARALERLREDFDRPLRIEDVIKELGMSVSGFHHFKAVTAMSPLQFQKQIRHQETRRRYATWNGCGRPQRRVPASGVEAPVGIPSPSQVWLYL